MIGGGGGREEVVVMEVVSDKAVTSDNYLIISI